LFGFGVVLLCIGEMKVSGWCSFHCNPFWGSRSSCRRGRGCLFLLTRPALLFVLFSCLDRWICCFKLFCGFFPWCACSGGSLTLLSGEIKFWFFFSSQRWRDGLFMLLLLFSASFLALFVCSLDFGFLVCFQICWDLQGPKLSICFCDAREFGKDNNSRYG
jgi:hypothetical protein